MFSPDSSRRIFRRELRSASPPGQISRTILDSNGAERLLGKGDMLFVPPGSSIPVRIHGAYVSDNEISQLVAHWRSQEEAIFQEDWFVEGGEHTSK